MSDGLTVPFALAAGLSGVANSTVLVITSGLAEIAAGSIDDDDSPRDLDQLTIAEAMPGNTLKVQVAVANVDALGKESEVELNDLLNWENEGGKIANRVDEG